MNSISLEQNYVTGVYVLDHSQSNLYMYVLFIPIMHLTLYTSLLIREFLCNFGFLTLKILVFSCKNCKNVIVTKRLSFPKYLKIETHDIFNYIFNISFVKNVLCPIQNITIFLIKKKVQSLAGGRLNGKGVYLYLLKLCYLLSIDHYLK